MIIVRLQGGLGNQLFQYAIGRVLAEINEDELILDTHGLYIPVEGCLSRDFMLDAFNINAKIADNKLIERIKKGSLLYCLGIKKLKHIKQLVFKETDPQKSYYRFADYICRPEVTKFYPDILVENTADIYLDGYWQSYKYFNGYEDLIKTHLTFKINYLCFDKTCLDEILNTNSVSIHLRLTDRVGTEFGLQFFRYLEWDYYLQAVGIINERIDNPHFFIFSDNIEWCQENLKIGFPVTYVKNQDEYNDLYLMGQCKHNIIAHSTFSWWAAWLNLEINKVVIAPKKWFNHQTDALEDLIPDTWIKI